MVDKYFRESANFDRLVASTQLYRAPAPPGMDAEKAAEWRRQRVERLKEYCVAPPGTVPYPGLGARSPASDTSGTGSEDGAVAKAFSELSVTELGSEEEFKEKMAVRKCTLDLNSKAIIFSGVEDRGHYTLGGLHTHGRPIPKADPIPMVDPKPMVYPIQIANLLHNGPPNM